uniref:Reverse transcriptase domain-containing protein n=3 Tax=Arion vulgaris TaxID=1028688 RepID=A0A0B7BSR0_9EUPU
MKNTLKALTIGAWNVRTLLDNNKAERPERRTALVARELARYDIDIAALSETRLPDEGQLSEVGGGYTFFWSGRANTERRESGVGFAVKSHLVRGLTRLPKGVSDRVMTLQISLGEKKSATLLSVYAPTMTNPSEIKDGFYEDLDSAISAVPRSEKLIILGDFNARVGTDHRVWDGVLGVHGVGKCNSNGLLLLRLCAAHDLTITNSLFRLPTRNKTSWMHPRSKQWHLIDYVIVRKNDRRDVRVTKAMCGAECWTDHRLIVSKLNLRIKPRKRHQGRKPTKNLAVSKLKSSAVTESLIRDLDDKLKDLQFGKTSVDDDWTALRDTVYLSTSELIGHSVRKSHDWFDENDEEIKSILLTKHETYRAYQNDPSSSSKKTAFLDARRRAQERIRKLQDAWLSKKSDEIQIYADRHDFKRFYDALKTVYGPQQSHPTPILDADGARLLIDKPQILNRWAEHFRSVLNHPSTICYEAIERMPQVPINAKLDIPPTLAEVKKATSQMSSGKAPGADSIPTEVYKEGGPTLMLKLTELFTSIWCNERVPQELKDATIVHLYKRKGNRQACDNHRGISLLSIAGKILARVLLNRLIDHLEQDLLPETQCGFRAGRGTADMIFAARQLQEKCQEQHRNLYMVFVDLTKAFDTVNREGLWKIMEKFGCPRKFIKIVQQFHEGMMARVLDEGELSEAFHVTNGVKQGCVLAPTLFSMMFAAMLTDVFWEGDEHGVKIRYRTDGNLFNLRRLKSSTKVKESTISNLLFADDCALATNSEEEMQT